MGMVTSGASASEMRLGKFKVICVVCWMGLCLVLSSDARWTLASIETSPTCFFIFSKERCLLYKVTVEQVFPCESLAKDRIKIIDGIIEDCKRDLELLPVRVAATDAQIFYRCADDDFEVVLKLRKESDGSRRLLLSIANRKVRDGRMGESDGVKPTFNADTDVDVAI